MSIQVYDILLDRIQNGKYAPGEKLNIDSLCKDLSVSNSPVREALSLLVANNLAFRKPNSGTYIIDFTPEDYNELTDAGNMLLMGAYDVCCRRGKKDLLLRQLNDQMENLKMYIHCGNDYDRINAILRFDRCFVTATENQMCIAQHDKEMTAIFLAYVYNHKNRSLDWQHNIDRSQTLIKAVAEDDAALVHEILCERANPHF